MGFASVQRKAKGANTSSLSIGAGDGWATPTSGNLLVVTANSDSTVSITGTWTAGPSVIDGNGTYIWYRISDGTESTITCTPGGGAFPIAVTACEYSGNAASPFDVSNSSTIAGSAGTTTTSVSVTTTADADLICAAALLHGYGTGGGGTAPTSPSWTNSFTNQLTAASGGTGGTDTTTFYAELLPAGTAGAYSTAASWTNQCADRQELVIAFKAAVTASATYPPQRPRSRAAVPLRVARTRQTVPVRAQVNPPYPFQEIDQARRLRGLLLRRGKLIQTVRPQVNPPYPFVEVVQERRLRGFPVRRGKVFSPAWPQQAATPAPPFVPDRLHRTRLIAIVRRERTVPPLAADLPVFGARRDRPIVPLVRRLRPGSRPLVDTSPPAGATRDRPNLAVAHRGHVLWVPLVGASPPPPPTYVPAVVRHRIQFGHTRRGLLVNPVMVCDCTTHRPNSGVIARPATGIVTRPDTGIVKDPCC